MTTPTLLQRMRRTSLERATLFGIITQVLLLLAARFLPWLENHALVFGGMMISSIAGYIYGKEVVADYKSCSLAGAIAGGTSGLIAVALAILIGLATESDLIKGTLVCILTGVVGGLFGQMSARMKTLI